jgi:small GTP-binding protein
MLNPAPIAYKIAFLGPCSGGKTSIIHRFHEGEFCINADPTVGANFATQDITTNYGEVSLHIWDTAGQERYKSLVPMYCRNALALIVVFDISSRDSYEESKEWCFRCRSPDIERQDIYFVANKIDLSPGIAEEDAAEFAQSVGAEFFMTSAKTGQGIITLFQAVATGLATKMTSASEALTEKKETSCCMKI